MQHYGILNYGITAYGLITALRHYGIYGLRFLITVFTSRAVTVNGISTATIVDDPRGTAKALEQDDMISKYFNIDHIEEGLILIYPQ